MIADGGLITSKISRTHISEVIKILICGCQRIGDHMIKCDRTGDELLASLFDIDFKVVE